MKPKKYPHAEVGRFSSLYFSIGLSAVLFVCWQALETQIPQEESKAIEMVYRMDDIKEEEIPLTREIRTPPPAPPPTAPDVIQIVEDIEDITETVIESTESSQDTYVEDAIVTLEDLRVEEVEEAVVVPFAVIEYAPVFPGCEDLKTQQEQKECFNQKMQEHVKQHFKYPGEALEMNISGRVYIQFVIDSSGRVTGIQKRGPDRLLEQEAERIISLLPQLKPGQQRGRPVSVRYAIPINFVMAN